MSSKFGMRIVGGGAGRQKCRSSDAVIPIARCSTANLSDRSCGPANSSCAFTTSASRSSRPQQPQVDADAQEPLSPRWLSDLKARIGRCISFGLDAAQVAKTGTLLETLARDWMEISAGSEGFLTGKGRAGLLGQRVVWGEMDCMSHVNNVTYTRYAESARIEWARNFAIRDKKHAKEWSELWTPKGDGLILRSIRTDYKFPMTWPDHISVFHKLRHEPSEEMDSFVLDAMVMSERHQRPSARCLEDIVVYDYQKGKKTNLKPFMAREFAKTFALQEEAKERNVERAKALMQNVRDLEKASWDKQGAREDFGAA